MWGASPLSLYTDLRAIASKHFVFNDYRIAVRMDLYERARFASEENTCFRLNEVKESVRERSERIKE